MSCSSERENFSNDDNLKTHEEKQIFFFHLRNIINEKFPSTTCEHFHPVSDNIAVCSFIQPNDFLDKRKECSHSLRCIRSFFFLVVMEYKQNGSAFIDSNHYEEFFSRKKKNLLKKKQTLIFPHFLKIVSLKTQLGIGFITFQILIQI